MIVVVVGAEALPPKIAEIIQAVNEDEVPYVPYANRLNDDGLFADLYLYDDSPVLRTERKRVTFVSPLPDKSRIVYFPRECFTVLHIREPPVTRL